MAKQPFGGKQGTNWKNSGMTAKRLLSIHKAQKIAADMRRGTGRPKIVSSVKPRDMIAKIGRLKMELEKMSIARMKGAAYNDRAIFKLRDRITHLETKYGR